MSPDTPIHCCRVPDERWKAAQKKAAEEGRTITDVVNRALEEYLQQQ